MLTESMNGLAGLLASKLLRRWMATLDYRACYADPQVDPARSYGSPRIYVFWHEYMLFPLYLRGNCHISMLMSRHKDADILARLAKLFGFGCVRGSTFRGGAAALRELAHCARRQHIAITPDGPRGPRRVMAQGPVYLASTLGMPIVALGFGYNQPWRMKSWDRFATPRPFSRARAWVSEEVWIPPALGRDGIEFHRKRVQQTLDAVTQRAEAWAATGVRRADESAVWPESASRPEPRQHAPRLSATPELLAA